MGNRRLSQGRIQKLVNDNTNRLLPKEEFQVKKVMLHPDQDADFGGTVTVSTELTREMSGRIVMINGGSAGNLTMTLPSNAVHGNHFTFLLVAHSHANTEILIDGDGSGDIRGLSAAVSGAVVLAELSSQTVGFADAEQRGAIIEVVFTGSKWFILRSLSTLALITSFS